MLKIDNIQTYNFDGAIRGMRNPLDSWDSSDSGWGVNRRKIDAYNERDYNIGEKDLKLAQSLIGAGSDESKFMRQIFVSMDITAPLYWWKQLDTYKVGTVSNSCSTMHKITSNELTIDDFSHEHLGPPAIDILKHTIETINYYIDVYQQPQLSPDVKKNAWWQIIQLLPSSFNQKRTWTANYQVLRSIYNARKYHKLDEWKEFCEIMESKFPYASELICYNKHT